MSSSFSSVVDSDASGPAGGADSIIYKQKPKHAYLFSHTLVGRIFFFPKGTSLRQKPLREQHEHAQIRLSELHGGGFC